MPLNQSVKLNPKVICSHFFLITALIDHKKSGNKTIKYLR